MGAWNVKSKREVTTNHILKSKKKSDERRLNWWVWGAMVRWTRSAIDGDEDWRKKNVDERNLLHINLHANPSSYVRDDFAHNRPANESELLAAATSTNDDSTPGQWDERQCCRQMVHAEEYVHGCCSWWQRRLNERNSRAGQRHSGARRLDEQRHHLLPWRLETTRIERRWKMEVGGSAPCVRRIRENGFFFTLSLSRFMHLFNSHSLLKTLNHSNNNILNIIFISLI